MNKLILCLLILGLSFGTAFAGFGESRLNIESLDESVSIYPDKLIFPNGSLTDNGDDTASVSFAGAGYLTSLNTSTPTNLTGFIKGNGSVLSADNSTYLTAEVDGSITNELPIAGTAIDISGSPASTVNVDTTEINSTTFGDNSLTSFIHTYDLTGTDVTVTFSSNKITFSGDLEVVGDLYVTDVFVTNVDGDSYVSGQFGIGLTTGIDAKLEIAAGSTTAGTAPIKLTSGALMTSPEVGAIEFLTDAFYGTITTGVARKQFAFTDSTITGNSANVSDTDFGDVTVSSGSWAVEDDSHAHTTTTISGLNLFNDVADFPADPNADMVLAWDDDPGVFVFQSAAAGSGDITSVGDCADGACFDGTQGTTLTFNNAGGDATIDYDGTDFSFSKPISANVTGALTGNADTVTNGVYTTDAGTVFLAPNGNASQLTSFPTLNQNTSGTASNLSGTPALPNGVTATTQSQADNSTKIASTAYVDTGLGTKVKSDGTVNPTQLLSNGDFENWSAGTSVAPDGWTLYSAGGGTVAREASTIKIGTYSAKITRVGNDTQLYQAFYSNKGANYWKNRTAAFSCWVWASVANSVFIELNDQTTYAVASAFHPGDSAWHLLTVSQTYTSGTITPTATLKVNNNNTSAYFDGAMCVEGESAFAFADKPATPLYGTFVANGASAVTVSDTRVAITDAIVISLNTVGGTVGVQPHVATITANTGFTVVCTASDTSTYNYYLLKRYI